MDTEEELIGSSKKTGRKRRFSREAAIKLAIEQGLEKFTLTSVASALHIAPSALYREFASHHELLLSCIDYRVHEVLQIPPIHSDTWQDELRAYSSYFWNLCSLYPEIPQFMVNYPEAFICAGAVIEEYVDRLIELKIPGGKDTAVFAVDTIGDSILFSYVSMECLNQPATPSHSRLQSLQKLKSSSAKLMNVESWSHQKGVFPQKLEFIIKAIELGAHETALSYEGDGPYKFELPKRDATTTEKNLASPKRKPTKK